MRKIFFFYTINQYFDRSFISTLILNDYQFYKRSMRKLKLIFNLLNLAKWVEKKYLNSEIISYIIIPPFYEGGMIPIS